MDRCEFMCYVCDCNYSVKKMMWMDWNPHAIFITIRTLNKFLKEQPENFSKIGEEKYLRFENNLYKVQRTKGAIPLAR